MITDPLTPLVKWSDDNIVDLIRKVRNDLIKDFLDDRFLREYLRQNFRILELPPIKMEFIRNALKEQLIRPVDLNHYRSLINEIRDTDSAALSTKNEVLFYKDIENLLKKFMY